MALIGDDYTTGDGLTLGVSLVLLEIPDEAWIKQVLISAFNTLTIEENWNDDYGDVTIDQATRIMSLMLQTLQFDYEPPIMTPVGAILMFGDTVAPTAWLLCDGSPVSRTTYAELFAVIGTAYGIGDGTTTFDLPDFTDRSPMGLSGSIVPGLGDYAGETDVTLLTTQIPAHNHAITDPGHTHGQQVSSVPAYFSVGGTGRTGYGSVATSSLTRVNTDNGATGISTQNAGNGNGHNNVHPVVGAQFIIYAGV